MATGFIYVTATFNGSPVTASWSVDSLTGATPASINLITGNYTLIVTYGTDSKTQMVTVTANQTTYVTVAFPTGGGGGGGGGAVDLTLPLILLGGAIGAYVLYRVFK